MAPTLSERAELARESLFQRYDQLNALWNQAEEELIKLHIPVGVECPYRKWDDGNSYEPDGYDTHACLGLQKVNGKWRICHGYCTDIHPDVEIWTPITECSADIRVQAAKHLQLLREAVVKSAEDFIPRVNKAIELLRESLSNGSSIKELLAERAKLNGKK